MKQRFCIILVLVIFTALFTACSGIVDNSAEERSTILSEDSELDLTEQAEFQEETYWSPPPELYVGGGYLSPTSLSETVAYENLSLWVKNYQEGIADQIYVDGLGLPITWRLTCDGSETYKIEQQEAGGNPAPTVYYSSTVLEGAIHYTFGSDLSNGPTLTVIKEYATGKGLDYAADSGANPVTYQEAKTIAISANVGDRPIVPENYVLSLDGYFSLQNVLFYKLKAENQEYGFHYVAISTDGSIVLHTGEMNNDIWYLVTDKNEQRIEWGEIQEPENAGTGEIPASVPVDDPLGLAGCWHDNQNIGSVHGDLYYFIEDGHFVYAASLNNSTERLRLSTGNWWIEGEMLYLTAAHLLILDTDADINAGTSIVEHLSVVQLSPGERVVEAYPVKIIQDEKDWNNTIMLGEQQLWRKDEAVTSYMAFFLQYQLIPSDYLISRN